MAIKEALFPVPIVHIKNKAYPTVLEKKDLNDQFQKGDEEAETWKTLAVQNDPTGVQIEMVPDKEQEEMGDTHSQHWHQLIL